MGKIPGVTMVLGIDCRATVAGAAGRGRLVFELVNALKNNPELTSEHRLRLYVREHELLESSPSNFEWCADLSRGPLWHRSVARDANRTCDVFLSTNSYLTPLFLKIPTVTYIYDLIPFNRQLKPRMSSAMIERLLLRTAAKRSDRLIAISQSTASDLIDRYPETASKTNVVLLAADTRFSSQVSDAEISRVLDKYGLQKKYVFVVGTLEPRKNLPRLIDAYVGLEAVIRDEYQLVIAGAKGWSTSEIYKNLEDQKDHVLPLGFVPDGDLAALYRACTVFCYPSLYEGLGLPVLEAMRAGAPVITSETSSMPEVGGDAAMYIDPHDTEDISTAISHLLKDDRSRSAMGKRGIEQSTKFSWDQVAHDVIEACQDVVSRRSRWPS